MINIIAEWGFCFFLYSIVGWFWESLYCSIRDRKITNRGFLFGPWCPIYGFGTILVMIIYQLFKWPWWVNFFAIIIICDVIEYITSVWLEKLFHVRWWDYTYTTKFSLNGRISLETSLCFGFGGIIMTEIIHPIIMSFVNSLNIEFRVATVFVLTVLFVMDIVLTNIAAASIKSVLKSDHGDLTSEFKKRSKNYYKKLFKNKR